MHDDLDIIYYTKRLYACNLYAKDFLTQFHNIIINDLPIATIQLKFSKYMRSYFRGDFQECFRQLNISNLIEQEELFTKIINYLEKNKYKMSTPKKIEIFSLWLYWLSLSNFDLWVLNEKWSANSSNATIHLEYYSFKYLHELAKTIVYEIKSPHIFYHYGFEYDNVIDTGSIYKEMQIQPDILTRAICSQSVENVHLLLDNGLKLEKYTSYQHPLLKSALHWAYYWDNLEIFDLLVKYGFRTNKNYLETSFYDPNFKKNFGLSLYLHFLREKKYEILDSLKFEDTENFMTSYKIYEHFKSEQGVIQLYESLDEIGFNLESNHTIHNRLDFRQSSDNYIQLIVCINQNGIKAHTIKYLIQKLKNSYNYSDTMIQNELVKSLKMITLLYQAHTLNLQAPRLKSNDFIEILSTILPMLNKHSIEMFNKSFENNYSELFNDLCLSLVTRKVAIVVDQDYTKHLYKKSSFKILDYFLNYKLYINEHVIHFFHNLCSIPKCEFSYEYQVETVSLLFRYLFQNQLINREIYFKLFRNFNIGPTFKSENSLNMVQKIYASDNEFKTTPKSLFDIARLKIRNSIASFSDQSLAQLNLARDLLVEIRETKKNF